MYNDERKEFQDNDIDGYQEQPTERQDMESAAQQPVFQQWNGSAAQDGAVQSMNAAPTEPAAQDGTAQQMNTAQTGASQQPLSNPADQSRYGWQRQTGGAPYHQPAPQMNPSSMPPHREQNVKSGRKKGSLAAKAAGITAAALLFGVVAGGTMFAVNTVGELVKQQYLPVAEQQETQPQVTVAEAETGADLPAAVFGAEVSPAVVMDVSSIVEKAMPSVVAIHNTMLMQQQTWFGPSQTVEVPSSGSGIIVGQTDDELLIVTNNHVVENSKEMQVTFIDEESVAAAIKGTDSETDLAVIAVSLKDIPSDTMSQIKVATLGDSDELKVGQGVIAIGNALGYGQSVTVGYVSALNREVKSEDSTTRTLLQTDAAINPGNSGGALLNMRGEVIGINAAKYSSTEVEGMGYAIPVSQVKDIINELMSKKTRVTVDEEKQGYLGIQGQNIDESAASMYGMPRGIYVYKIMEDSAAANSDLREKDIITKFDGQTVRTMADLKDMLTYYEGGSTVTLTVQSLENGQYVERSVEITLGTKSAGETN